MTCGVIAPAIVLPADAQQWSPEDLRRAIVHELEHVRRADWLTHCLARVACAVYWFHPLVWIAWRELRARSGARLRRCGAAPRRGDGLRRSARSCLAARLSSRTGPPVLAMANRHDLSSRVLAVLDARQRARPRGSAVDRLRCAPSPRRRHCRSRRFASSPPRRPPTPSKRDGKAGADAQKFDVDLDQALRERTADAARTAIVAGRIPEHIAGTASPSSAARSSG